jgi:hypothetical protein
MGHPPTPPISNEKIVEGKNVSFWHKNIDEVVVHRIKLELEHHGPTVLDRFNVLDVVLGAIMVPDISDAKVVLNAVLYIVHLFTFLLIFLIYVYFSLVAG